MIWFTQHYPLVGYDSQTEYRDHFLRAYCESPVTTLDQIDVYFRPEHFRHAFFEGCFKQRFSLDRAQRIDWIKVALRDRHALLRRGWDHRGFYTSWRRVCVVRDFVVVIQLDLKDSAHFVTAYNASTSTLRKILNGPIWRR